MEFAISVIPYQFGSTDKELLKVIQDLHIASCAAKVLPPYSSRNNALLNITSGKVRGCHYGPLHKTKCAFRQNDIRNKCL